MKRLKKIFSSLCAIVMLLVATISLSACERIKTLEITVLAGDTEYTMEVDLYCHLAPKTTDAIIDLVEAEYYNGSAIYKLPINSYQIMMGELKMEDGKLVQATLEDGTMPPQVKGEFERNGVKGSNLTNVKGSVGLYRSNFEENDKNYQNTSEAMNSGRSAWYLPTDAIHEFEGYFCIFAQIDLENDKNQEVFDKLTQAFADQESFEEYTIYYTGEYDEEKPNENFGLTFNSMKKADFEKIDTIENGFVTLNKGTDNEVKVFRAEGKQLECYNYHTVQVANNLKIVSIKVK